MQAYIERVDARSVGIASVLVFLGYKYYSAYKLRSKLAHIPSLGPDGVLSSYITVWRLLTPAAYDIIDEGCLSWRCFQDTYPDGWQVLVNGPKMIDEFRRASDDVLSSIEATDDVLHVSYTISPDLLANPYHIETIRGLLTRNLGARFNDVVDEIGTAFNDNIPPQADWIELNVIEPIQRIVSRSSNRLFFGLPLCRNEEYVDININFAINVILNITLISFFPKMLHPIVGNIFTARRRYFRRTMVHLGPIVRQRIEMEKEYGKDWPDRPNDLISWLIDTAEQIRDDWQKHSVEDIVLRVLAANFAAIHTTSSAFTQALYHLCANPHLIQALREEVETVVGKDRENWSKANMVQLRLLDSFLKESQRHVGSPFVSSLRVVLQDFKFSDGTAVPAGTKVGLAPHYVHHYEPSYASANDFVGNRFFDLRKQEGEGTKHQMVSLDLDYVIFGTGKHACPGRFFAVNELKAMFIHLLLTYDFKFRDETAGFPPVLKWGGSYRT